MFTFYLNFLLAILIIVDAGSLISKIPAAKEKKVFHYDIFEDNGIDGQRLFGVKLSIDDKVIAKARATSKKKAEEKASQRAYFAFQDKMNKK